jgi:chorismate dehydratase
LEKKIKVGAVSYLNTKPLIYGLQYDESKSRIDLIIDYPSRIATMLLENRIDVGLVPVAIIPELNQYEIISDYCIAADGEVQSVGLYAQVPLSRIDRVLLDYQSKTSVQLLKILLRDHWNIQPQLENGGEEYIKNIHGTTAGLIIGDRALENLRRFNYTYDLAQAWKELTGLPFVFAAWIARKNLPSDFLAWFNEANQHGLTNIEEIINANQLPGIDLKTYYTQRISYLLDEKKKLGLKLFLEKLAAL